MNTKLKNYLLAKTDPAMAMAIYLETVDKLAQSKIDKMVADITTRITSDFERSISQMKEQVPAFVIEIEKEIKKELDENPDKFRGLEGQPGTSIKGEKGKPGPRGLRGRRGPRGLAGKPGNNGRTPIAGLDFPTYKEIEKDVERVVKSKALKIKDLKPLILKLVDKSLKKAVKDIDANEIARMIEALPLAKKLDYHSGLKNQPDLSDKEKGKLKKGGGMGGGGGWTILTPTGTVDSTNTIFTVTSPPAYIVADGIAYFEGAGYTRSGLTITMTSPPASYIRSYH